MNNKILIYQHDGQAVEVRLDIEQETELDREATVAKNAIVQMEGQREVKRTVDYYNLDAIISVGYRVNSRKGTQFRIWATQRLREYLVQGYSINQQRFDSNAAELQQAIALIQKAAKSEALTAESGSGLVEIVSRYTQTFIWLQQYDEGMLNEPTGQKGGILPNAESAMQSLLTLRQSLIERGEATELFASLREDGLASILGNLDQTVFGDPAYPTIESKAAHLLYFIIKNHPFSDGKTRQNQHISLVMYWSSEGKPITAREFVERMFDDLPQFFQNEDQLRAIWSDPTTREKLLLDLAEAGYDAEKLDSMKDLIDARDSDVYDVLAYIAYAAETLTRVERAKSAKPGISLEYGDYKQQQFIDFILDRYIDDGAHELALEKMKSLIELKYNTISDAAKEFGSTAAIRELFIGFQHHLYEVPSPAQSQV